MFAKTLLIAAITLLTGCVNYMGMQPSQSTALQPSDLRTHSNQKFTHSWPQDNWWVKFRDPQLCQLEEQGIANSPNLKVAQARLRIAEQLTNQANAATLPSTTLQSNIQRERLSQNSLFPPAFIPTSFTLANIGAGFNYDFDFWGKNREALAAALSEAQATKADLAAARLILTTAVAQAYFQVQADQIRVNLAKETVNQYSNFSNLTGSQFNRGLTSDLDFQQSKSNVETAKVNLAKLQQALEIDQHQLAVLLGRNPQETVYVKQAQNHIAPTLPKVLSANLIARRPDIIALRLRIEENSHNIKSAKAQFYPDVNLAAASFGGGFFGSNVGFQSVGALSNLLQAKSLSGTIGPALSLPLFDGGNLRANLGVQYGKFDVAVEQYNQQILTSMREVADQVSILRSAQKQLAAQNINLRATQKNYELTQLRYKNGLDDALTTAQAKIPYLAQRDVETQLQLQHQLATVGLIKALGGGY